MVLKHVHFVPGGHDMAFAHPTKMFYRIANVRVKSFRHSCRIVETHRTENHRGFSRLSGDLGRGMLIPEISIGTAISQVVARAFLRQLIINYQSTNPKLRLKLGSQMLSLYSMGHIADV